MTLSPYDEFFFFFFLSCVNNLVVQLFFHSCITSQCTNEEDLRFFLWKQCCLFIRGFCFAVKLRSLNSVDSWFVRLVLFYGQGDSVGFFSSTDFFCFYSIDASHMTGALHIMMLIFVVFTSGGGSDQVTVSGLLLFQNDVCLNK